jgi:hypothetical protein
MKFQRLSILLALALAGVPLASTQVLTITSLDPPAQPILKTKQTRAYSMMPVEVDTTFAATSIDTIVPAGVDTIVPAGVDTIVPAGVDTIVPAGVDTIVPADVDTLAPVTTAPIIATKTPALRRRL